MTRPSKFVTTGQWGANDSRNATPTSHPMHHARGVSLHWVGPGRGVVWAHHRCAHMVQAIERHHEFGNGWGDIAYNALVCPHGWVFEGRGANVRSSANGSTASNGTHYAVCYLGGVGDEFTEDAQGAFVDAVQWLRTEGHAGDDVNGHRDHKATDCPGGIIYRWLRAVIWNPAPPPELSRGKRIDAAIRKLWKAARRADRRDQPIRKRRIQKARQWLKKIRER